MRHKKIAHRKRRGGSHENPEMQTIEKVEKFSESLFKRLKRVRTGSFDAGQQKRGISLLKADLSVSNPQPKKPAPYSYETIKMAQNCSQLLY